MHCFYTLSLLLFFAVSAQGLPRDPNQRRINQQLKCWDQLFQEGSPIAITEHLAELDEFDDKIQSCCFTGVWIFYEDSNFNANRPTQALSYWNYGDGDNCLNIPPSMRSKASSIRFAGESVGHRFDTLTLYGEENFAGSTMVFTDDNPELALSNFGSSAIVTGLQGWTLYEKPNFKGNSICLHPRGDATISPEFYPLKLDLDHVGGRVSSVRKQCYENGKD